MSPRRRRLSYSGAATYKRCPAAWDYQYIQQLPRGPVGPAASRGTSLHMQMDKYFRGELDKLSVEFWRVRERLAAIRELRPNSELTLLVDNNWRPVPDESTAAWIAIIDILYQVDEDTAHIIDLKSGKIYDEHMLQLNLYATVALSLLPVKRVHVSALYMDSGVTDHEMIYTREQLPAMQDAWNQTRLEIVSDFSLEPKPSVFSCRFCDYSAKKGGPCNSYWREEKQA